MEADITISRETLRAELAEFELRLTDRLASKETVVDLQRRVQFLEQENAESKGRKQAGKAHSDTRRWFFGGIPVALFVICVQLAVQHYI